MYAECTSQINKNVKIKHFVISFCVLPPSNP